MKFNPVYSCQCMCLLAFLSGFSSTASAAGFDDLYVDRTIVRAKALSARPLRSEAEVLNEIAARLSNADNAHSVGRRMTTAQVKAALEGTDSRVLFALRQGVDPNLVALHARVPRVVAKDDNHPGAAKPGQISSSTAQAVSSGPVGATPPLTMGSAIQNEADVQSNAR